jgi:hypothetical protein
LVNVPNARLGAAGALLSTVIVTTALVNELPAASVVTERRS